MKKSITDDIVTRLEQFTNDLVEGKTISEKYTCRRVVLNLKPTVYTPEKIKATRGILSASQAMFAQLLGVKVKTVQSWEQGIVAPSDMASRFMDEIRNNPKYWLERFQGALTTKV
jgi:putative transcriptional regulator